MPRSSLTYINVRSPQTFSEPFPGYTWALSIFLHICSCFLMFYSLMSESQKGKRKMKSWGAGRITGTDPLNVLKVTWGVWGLATMWVGIATKMSGSSLHLCGQKQQSVIRAQSLIFGEQGGFCPCGIPQSVCKLLQEHTQLCHAAGVGDGQLLLC